MASIQQAQQYFEDFLKQYPICLHEVCPSTLCGEAGNQEYLYWMERMTAFSEDASVERCS